MLKKAAHVAVVAPAGIPDIADVEQSIALLRSWGMTVREGKNLRARYRYNAGTAQQRSDDLVWALSDPNIDAVWLARGGYGVAHCLPQLPAVLPRDRIVIGYSDATALFSTLWRRGHRNLVHGPMAEELAAKSDDESRAAFRSLLFESQAVTLTGTHLCGPKKTVTGPLLGGNLAVLASIAGTPASLHGAGAIILLEDITELAYRIDRTIMQLRASGMFDGALGIVLGDFIKCPLPKDADFTLQDVFRDLLEPLGVPVVWGAAVGHGSRNLAWRYGQSATLRDGSIYW